MAEFSREWVLEACKLCSQEHPGAALGLVETDDALRVRLAKCQEDYISLKVENTHKGNMILEYDKIQQDLKKDNATLLKRIEYLERQVRIAERGGRDALDMD